MDEEKFLNQHGRLFQALKERRETCPEPALLLACQQGEVNAERKSSLEKHLAVCALCQELVERLAEEPAEVDEFTWRRMEKKLDQRSAPWRTTQRKSWFLSFGLGPLGAVAAVLLLSVVTVLWISSSEEFEFTGPVSTTRGPAIQIVQPGGVVQAVQRFEWSAPPLQADFRLQIQEGDQLIWEETIATTSYLVPRQLQSRLEPGKTYRWRVLVSDSQGTIIAESSWAEFKLALDPK